MPKTACNQCLNRIVNEKSNGEHIWYNNTCKAKKNEKQFNPITGEMEYSDKVYVYCRELNRGDCEFFEEKENHR